MMQNAPLPPRVLMVLTGPLVGLISGVVLGLFALAASRLIGTRGTDLNPPKAT